MIRYGTWFTLLSIVVGLVAVSVSADEAPDPSLRVVIIRHAEKPADGDNLSCQGMNRALRLPAVLHQKFQTPKHVYVPTLSCGKSTAHSRMFQTVSPFAAKHNLKITSEFDEKDSKGAASDVLKKKGTVLMVWNHSEIPHLLKAFGAGNGLTWEDDDFDSILIISFVSGNAKLTHDSQGIAPGSDCAF